MALEASITFVRQSSPPAVPLIHSHVDGAMSTLPNDSDITVIIDRRRDRCVAAVTGMLDEGTVAEFRLQVSAVYDDSAPLVILDMAGVPLVDSDGFGALINMQKRLTESGKTLALVRCQNAVRLALSLTRLEILLPTYSDVESIQAA